MSSIDAIIFDLGGVIINIDYHKTIHEFVSLGIQDFEKRYSQLKQTHLFDDFETGRIPAEEFYQSLCKEAGIEIEQSKFWDAWDAMLLDLPGHRLDFLMRINEQFKTFLLSNTNEAHLHTFHESLKNDHGLASLENHFDELYYSCNVGMRKPNQEIFEKILNDNGLEARCTLFVDDTSVHIEAAKALGIQTLHLPQNTEVEKAVLAYLESAGAS